jgi:hypothetical protein
MKTLKEAWLLWEEKGWESSTPKGEKIELPKGKSEEERPEIVVTSKETPSKLNSLVKVKKFVPGKDKDAKIMQLKTELGKLEEELAFLELEESMITPDVGSSLLGRSNLTGAAIQPPNGYGRNTCEDPPAPEEIGQHQDASNTLVAPKQWTP